MRLFFWKREGVWGFLFVCAKLQTFCSGKLNVYWRISWAGHAESILPCPDSWISPYQLVMQSWSAMTCQRERGAFYNAPSIFFLVLRRDKDYCFNHGMETKFEENYTALKIFLHFVWLHCILQRTYACKFHMALKALTEVACCLMFTISTWSIGLLTMDHLS